ncbi:MAG: aldo/keto reductase [Anaerolineales bacterium]
MPDPHGTLPRRPYGQTGLEVTAICIGCAPLGDMPETFQYAVPEEQALETLRAVFRSPINFLDTAASYGDGESERRIGLVLKEMGGLPAGVVLATKADRDLHTGDFSGPQMRRSVERSLRLLGLDRLQLVYLHDPEHTTFEKAMAPGGPVEVLQQMRNEGLIQHLGLAGGPVDMEVQYLETGHFEAVITHNRYTLLNRTAATILDGGRRRGMGVANAAPYGSGILAKGPSAYPRYAYQQADEKQIEQARQIEAACRRHGVPLAAAALQFSLRDPRIDSTIIGISRPERVTQTLELASHPIPAALWTEIEPLIAPEGGPSGDVEAGRFK